MLFADCRMTAAPAQPRPGARHMDDQRNHPRFEERNIVTIKELATDSQSSGPTFSSLTTSLSGGGLAFSTYTRFTAGAKLHLSVTFAQPVKTIKGLAGRVAWVQPVPHGAQYIVGVDLSESPVRLLKEWKTIIHTKIAAS